MIETWGFCEDIKDINGINLMMMMTMRWRITTRMTTIIRVAQLWNMIETWGFREDIKDISGINLMMMMTMTTRWRTTTRKVIPLMSLQKSQVSIMSQS